VGPREGDVDWDLLADHLGGALAGTPEAARVERLVSTDPGWARAATELSAAMAAVAGDLRTLPAPTMPDDVAVRLERALAAAGAVPDVSAAGGLTTGAPVAGGRSTGEPRRPPGRPRRRRGRVAKWGAGLAVAAGVVAFAAVGLSGGDPEQAVPGLADSDDGGGEAAAPQAPEEDGAAPRAEALPPLVVATGSNYDASTLEITEPTRPSPQLGGQNLPSPPVQAPEHEFGTNDAAPPVVPESLLRLWTDPQERAECLSMISETLQPPPVTINTVDFATYEGEPALVIWATTGDGSRWGWVSGPDCGAVAGDPDVWFQTQLS
jgi:hypothetical protein